MIASPNALSVTPPRHLLATLNLTQYTPCCPITRDRNVTTDYSDWYCVECPQSGIRIEALGYLCDCLSGRDLMTSSDHTHLDRQRYVACRQPASDVEENLEEVSSCTESTDQGNDFE